MTLSLDLSSSYAKIDRAEELLRTFKTEIPLAIGKRHPHSIRGEIDPQTGWCSVRLRRNNPQEPRLATIMGDYIHNLRSALNYIVTALVDATPGLTLGTMHQFPIYDDPTEYASKVWRMGEGVGRGLKASLRASPSSSRCSPITLNPTLRLPLAHLNHFSIADKHREILGYWPDPQPGEIEIDLGGGTVVERRSYQPTSPG